VLALELKDDGDRLRPGQAEWITALGGHHGGIVSAGIVTGAELDLVLARVLGRASEAELRAGLLERWQRAGGAS
jgi:hypothetical protein